MMCSYAARARGAMTASLKTIAVAIALVPMLVGNAWAVDMSAGPKEVIYTQKQRSNLKLGMWPDGNMGVVANAQGTYDFYGPNGGSPAKSTGPLWNPGASKQSVKI